MNPEGSSFRIQPTEGGNRRKEIEKEMQLDDRGKGKFLKFYIII